MRARFEKKIFSDTVHTSACKYKNLRNLPHWHIEYEIVCVFKGTTELMVNNSFYEMSANMCAFINSEEIHYIKANQDSIVGVIKTDAEYVKKIVKKERLVCPVLKCTLPIKEAFSEISVELSKSKPFGEIVADSIITKIIAEIFRNEITAEKNVTSLKTANKLKDLLEMISDNFTHITFEKAAQFLNLNKSYFSRYFYHSTGMTFTRYLNILKVSSAIEKINSGQMNITEISIACGFGTIRNFNRVFKNYTGYSPKKLPADYVLIYNFKNTDTNGFDPTLNCTELIDI